MHMWSESVYYLYTIGLFAYQLWFILRCHRTKNQCAKLTALVGARLLAVYVHLAVHSRFESFEQYKPWRFWDQIAHLCLHGTTIALFRSVDGFEFGDKKIRMVRMLVEYVMIPLNIFTTVLESSPWYGSTFSDSLNNFWVIEVVLLILVLTPAMLSNLRKGHQVDLRQLDPNIMAASIAFSSVVTALAIRPQTAHWIMEHNFPGHLFLTTLFVNSFDQFKVWPKLETMKRISNVDVPWMIKVTEWKG